MTVVDLITELQKYPPTPLVMVPGDDDDMFGVRNRSNFLSGGPNRPPTMFLHPLYEHSRLA